MRQLKIRQLLGRIGPFLAMSGLVGCGHPIKRQLEGRWFGDSIENVEPSQLAAATGWTRGTSFEFSGDQITVVVPAEEPRTGSYEVAAARAGDVTLDVRRADGADYKLELRMDGEHSLRWLLPEGKAVVMRRAD